MSLVKKIFFLFPILIVMTATDLHMCTRAWFFWDFTLAISRKLMIRNKVYFGKSLKNSDLNKFKVNLNYYIPHTLQGMSGFIIPVKFCHAEMLFIIQSQQSWKNLSPSFNVFCICLIK